MPTVEEVTLLAAVLGADPSALAAAQAEVAAEGLRGEGYVTRQTSERSVRERLLPPPRNCLKVLDLFCGSGGFSHGFEQSNSFAVTAGIDLLSDRADTYRENHRFAATIIADLREFETEDLATQALGPDIIIGGPPCQGFSSIRPFRDRGRGDPRNNLFEEFAWVVENIRPEWFVLENVVGLLTHEKGSTLRTLVETFQHVGYTVSWKVLNAALFGLPQNRERIVVVGNRRGKRFVWPSPTHVVVHRSMAGSYANRLFTDPLFGQDLRSPVTVMDAIGDLPPVRAGEAATSYDDAAPFSDYARSLRGSCEKLTLHEATAHSAKMLEIIRHAGSNRSALPPGLTTSGFSSCYSRLEADRPSVTITVNFVHPSSNKCIHPVQDRALTPREGARLQSFPDSFQFCGTRSQIVKQIGNAVPPLLGETIAKAVASQW